ncbi:MAG: tRNA pseudouridine(13) synthase TruD [Myxococcota bacterium]|jgi:tRNA pseudouridine13 synthase
MKLKQRPEDFSVKESYRFDEVKTGTFRVYLMDKQKLSTFDAIARIQQRFGLKPGAISYCGLKDKQGRTEQLIAVDGHDVDLQDPDLRLTFLGRTDRPLSSANTTSNRFAVTVRQLREADLHQVTVAAAEVNRLGVVNYFDSQRFGSLKHGQGFIAKDLIRGDFEAALRNYLARPSTLDRTDDAKVKAFWAKHWGDWTAKCPFEANKKYVRVLKSLRDEPRNFVKAFLQIDADYRAMLLFTYQSYLWNEGVRRLLQILLPREQLFPMPYQAGTLLHHTDAPPEVLSKLRGLSFPLLAPDTTFDDPQVEEAATWVLGREKLKLADLRIEEAPKLLYFKHELRPVLVYPQKLVIGKPRPDELNRGFIKVNVAFTLPPGSYATLTVKRLFHFGVEKEQRSGQDVLEPRHPPPPRKRFDHKTGQSVPRQRDEARGFRAQQQAKKALKAQRRNEAGARRR